MSKQWNENKINLIINVLVETKNIELAHQQLIATNKVRNKSLLSFSQHLARLILRYLNIDINEQEGFNKIISGQYKLDGKIKRGHNVACVYIPNATTTKEIK